MVCLIQSVSSLFGSHVVVPGTGFALQNRGQGFTLDASHSNRLEPGKRSFHTIIPGFLTYGGKAIGPFGVGGDRSDDGCLWLRTDHLAIAVRSICGRERWANRWMRHRVLMRSEMKRG